jgi:hypothetical protein
MKKRLISKNAKKMVFIAGIWLVSMWALANYFVGPMTFDFWYIVGMAFMFSSKRCI